jgi:SAM-dependent methyltransferase
MYRVRRVAFRRYVRPASRREPANRVVDIGSGTGFYINLWQQLGVAHLTGVDITTVAVDALRARFPAAEFVRADISEEFAPLEAAADIVSAFDVLFHVVDDAAFTRSLRNIAAMLRPGGLFVLSDVFQHDSAFGTTHQVGRTLETILRELDSAGFDVELRRPVFVFMADPTDSHSRILRLVYSVITRAVSRGRAIAWAVGALMYPIEVVATRIRTEGPSIELMIARRR